MKNMRNKLNQSIKEAMLSKQTDRLNALRGIKSEFDKAGNSASDMDLVKMLKKMLTQRLESLDIYTKNGRTDLATIEKFESEVISEFIPEQMSMDKVKEFVTEAMSQLGLSKDSFEKRMFGQVLKKTMELTENKVDNKDISTAINELTN